MKTWQIEMISQPTETTCGPTCLFGIYRHFKRTDTVDQLIQRVQSLPEGGTLGVYLAQLALHDGFRVQIYTYNLHIFDPTWIDLSNEELKMKLKAQADRTQFPKKRRGSLGYIDFLDLGGEIIFEELTPELLQGLLAQSPFICGLSATYLYRTSRELGESGLDDDVMGEPQGHFVIATGVSPDLNMVTVADPYRKNPISGSLKYQVTMDRFLNSILLGVITYDANLIFISPKK